MIVIRTYEEMTSGEKRSLTLSIKKYADIFVDRHGNNGSGFASEEALVDEFYKGWLEESLASHYAWCAEKKAGGGYEVKGYHEQDQFVTEAKVKIRGILAEKMELDKLDTKEEASAVKEEAEQPTTRKKADMLTAVHLEKLVPNAERNAKKVAQRKKEGKLGRNDACPCGSGDKYKNCCEKKGIRYKRIRNKFIAT
ncbi:SEC-C motif-containing protein [Aneurinibacillus soli]|uniref:Preprotein translocase subunit SecA n=1 Tax=Aneurinibacillus soli TaxID=1500254 RepID=A0A0U4WGX1_9BACL|nr:SEC-C metal-binding domain-containing protein [Aneurinibacillus soli]PYE63980.1 SEC-C motif-containing protein [Aneurinibacillus soli]BAU27929.1 preprotein translocase subunit SecA [Aneurinibacillus soli]